MNRKGEIESFTMLQSIPRLIFLIVVALSVIFLVRQFVADTLDVKQVQAEVFANRLIYSPNGILYYDAELKSTIPGIIDSKKITNEVLDSLMKFNDESFVAGKVRLFDVNNFEIASAKYNGKTYDRWITLAKLGVEGSGGVTQINKTRFVSYFEDGAEKQGVLKLDILLPGK